MKRSYCLKTLLLTAFFALAMLVPILSRGETGTVPETAGPLTAEDIEQRIGELSRETDLSDWEIWFDRLKELSHEAAGFRSVNGFIEALAENPDAAVQNSFSNVLAELFLPGLRSALSVMIPVAAIAVLTGLCSIVFDEGGTKKLVLLFLCASAILGVTAVFSGLAGEVDAAVNDAASFCGIAAPALGTLLAGMGAAASAGLLAPRLAFAADGIAAFIRSVVIPMLLASGVLTVLNGLTDALRLGRTVKLLHKTAKWLLALAGACYTAFAVAGGLGAAAADGISFRTARFAVDRLIPAAGGLVGGAADALRAGTLLFKNAAGSASILILAAVILRPLMTAACGMLAFRAAAAVTEPFSDERIPGMLDGLADTVSLLFAAACSVFAMFTVTVMMIIAAGSTMFG